MESLQNSFKQNIQKTKDKVIDQRSVLPDKKTKKNTIFLELEGVLYESYTPHINEGYLYLPDRKFDRYFEITNPMKQLFLIHVYLRPGWKEFLQFLSSNFETILYTRTEKFYTDEIMNQIGKKYFDFIQYRLYQEYCSDFQFQNTEDLHLVKIIEGLNRDLESSIIIDNKDIEAIMYPQNYLSISSYDAIKDKRQEDNELQILQKILENFKNCENTQQKMSQLFNNEKLLKELEIIQ